jgi:hypothetical protein
MTKQKILYLLMFFMHAMLYSQNMNRWDISFGNGLKGPESAPAAITLHENALHIGGHFTRLNSNTPQFFVTGHITYYKDDSWQDMEGGLNAPIKAMCSANDGRLYVSGGFTLQGLENISGIAYWAHDGTSLYAGGIFPGIGNAKSSAIARYSNGTWHALETGLGKIPSQMKSQAEVKVLQYAQGKLFVGGDFDSAGLIPAKNIAYWDGTLWHALGLGLPGTINDITILNNGNIIVASTITKGNIKECAPLMSWNGSNWTTLGLPPNCISIQALSTDGMNVFIGGEFTMDSLNKDNGLAIWNGNSFTSIGGGVQGKITSLYYHDGMLYCGGSFLKVSDSLTCRNIAGFRFKEKEVIDRDSSLKIKTFPNPNQSGKVSISFYIEEPGEAELCIITSDGRILQCFAQAYYTAGLHEIILNTDGISSGQYQCTLYQKGNTSTTTMLIMH